MIKRLEMSVLIAFIVTVMFSFVSNGSELPQKDMKDKVIRLHILANSNSEDDQSLKLAVRDGVLKFMRDNVKGGNKSSAEKSVDDNLPAIERLSRDIVTANGYSYSVTARREEKYFTARRYGSIALGAGVYDALVITIGSGSGNNWWCVAYPPLCIPPAEEKPAAILKPGLSNVRVKYIPKVWLTRNRDVKDMGQDDRQTLR